MHVTFVGCGDAFGSGGRLNTCFHVRATRTTFLIDCGASSLIGMNRFGIDRNAIDTILVTHFHADHFGGIPFFMLDAQFNTKRTRPLTIAGPAGLRDWYQRAMDTAFAGSSKTQQKFELNLVELESAERVLGVTSRDDESLSLQVPSDGDIPALRALLDRLDDASVKVRRLSIHTPDLDDVFFALTSHPDSQKASQR